uniref:Uncharacterized protein n=1 Tax=Lactuca sativa TaxID=4236 RepID=A0A9R1WRH9_LACSA|nr:hypothetical protein LSAT_V11C100003120 [Lactuca sativa]
MVETISMLQKKGMALHNQNNTLSKKQLKVNTTHIKQVKKRTFPTTSCRATKHYNMPSIHFNTFTRICDGGIDGSVESIPREGQPSIVLPPWMLQHINH